MAGADRQTDRGKGEMENELRRIGREVALVIGLIVIALIIGGLLVWAIYSVIGTLTDNGRHWLAVGLVFAVPLAYALGLQVAKSHKAGIERGLDLKIGAAQRQSTVKPTVQPTPKVSPAAQFNDVLPQVTPQAQIVMRTDDAQSTIDM